MNQKLLASVVVFVSSSIAFAQQQDLQRFERQLEQLRRDTRLQVNPDVPVGQRVYLDYGGFTSLNYLSLDDSNLDNRALREYDLTLYAHLNLDGVHDFFVR